MNKTSFMKAFVGATTMTGVVAAAIYMSKIAEALYLVLVAPILLGGLSALGVPSLVTDKDGFIEPSPIGWLLSAILYWLLLFLLLLRVFSSENNE